MHRIVVLAAAAALMSSNAFAMSPTPAPTLPQADQMSLVPIAIAGIVAGGVLVVGGGYYMTHNTAGAASMEPMGPPPPRSMGSPMGPSQSEPLRVCVDRGAMRDQGTCRQVDRPRARAKSVMPAKVTPVKKS